MWMLNTILLLSAAALVWAAWGIVRHIRQQKTSGK
jgi:hypothetical protein